MTTIPGGPVGPQPAPLGASDQHALGFFWPDGPPPEDDAIPANLAHLDSYADRSALVQITRAFLQDLDRQAEKVDPLKLDGPISRDEWWSARSSQPSIVDQWFYEDVGCFIAPGGTGKTTLLLFQVIHIVLGRELFGYEVTAPEPVVFITAEDSRETLIARLRQMCIELRLTEAEVSAVREDVIITDVSGKGIKFTKVEKDVVMPSAALDKLIVEIGVLKPSLLIVDPLVSFGVGESRVNDAEQGMIDAARRIRNAVQCAVIYVHHTGKENARNRTTDQYSGRGGSALADGSRMVHVLNRLTPEEWTEATGNTLEGLESGFVLARPKITWAAPQPDVYIKRRGYLFERHDHIEGSEGAKAVHNVVDEKVWQYIKDELIKGNKHTQNTLESCKLAPQKTLRQSVQRLLNSGRLDHQELGTGGRGGARQYLRAIEPAAPT